MLRFSILSTSSLIVFHKTYVTEPQKGGGKKGGNEKKQPEGQPKKK